MIKSSESALISNLKGRISKVLGSKTILRTEEREGLNGIYRAIDSLILSRKGNTDVDKFKNKVVSYADLIRGTNKNYIKDHIIPVVDSISTEKWGHHE